jgi:hypothetical protein
MHWQQMQHCEATERPPIWRLTSVSSSNLGNQGFSYNTTFFCRSIIAFPAAEQSACRDDRHDRHYRRTHPHVGPIHNVTGQQTADQQEAPKPGRGRKGEGGYVYSPNPDYR